MSAMLGPLEPEVDNPTVGKRMLDFTGFMDASEFAEIQAPFPACFNRRHAGFILRSKSTGGFHGTVGAFLR